MLTFKGPHAAIIVDATPEILVEGALSSGKTIMGLWKELEALKRYPGMWSFVTRWTEAGVNTLLRTEFERVARIHGSEPAWNSREKAYEFPNGSRCFAFHLHTTEIEPMRRYGKIRGLPVSRIMVDQAEELPQDFPVELRRRLRPDIEAKTKGITFPTQLTFIANPPRTLFHWLVKQFPVNNAIENRKYYTLSLMDNAHHLPAEMIKNALIDCPPTDPRYREIIMGQRPAQYDYAKLEKKPFTEDMAGWLFEQAKNEAWKYAR